MLRDGLTRGCIRNLLVALGVSLLANQVSAVWNEQALEQAAEKARHATLLLANKRGELFKELGNSDERDAIINAMRFNSRGKLVNGGDIYYAIADKIYSDQTIGLFYAAALDEEEGAKANSLFHAYRDILYSDYSSEKFALKQLDAIADEFNEDLYEEYKSLRKNFSLSVYGSTVYSNQDKAEFCLEFSKTIASEPAQLWRPLIQISPEPLNEGIYRGDEICYYGEWQTNYTIKVSPEIMSDNGITLGYEEGEYSEVVYTGDRDPMVRLGTKGQTIVAGDDAAITVESANVDTVMVEVWSVPITNLSQTDIVDILNPTTSADDYYFDSANLNHNARLIYEGKFDTNQRDINDIVDARLRLVDMNISEPGVYIVKVGNSDDMSVFDNITFSVSEVGFSAYKTDDGLWAELRDLRDFSPVSGANVVLYSRDNSVLAQAKTDKMGMAGFDQAAVQGKGGATPDHIIYQDKKSLAYLYLDHQGFDLSDKGLEDRRSQADISAWLWLDRGVYRPNDQLHAMWLLKHGQDAYHERDLWVSLRRPDGVIMHEQMIAPDDSGAYRFDYEFANTASLGPWQLDLSFGKDAEIINQSVVRVDAIQAQQIETSVNTVSLTPTITLAVQADWLYGSPAKGLRTDADWKIVERNWPDYRHWQIGRYDEQLSDAKINVPMSDTDEKGSRTIEIDPSVIAPTTRPLSVDLDANVYTTEGQLVVANTVVDVLRDQPYVALQVNDKQAKVALVQDDGSLVSDTLTWSLYRVYRDGYWYRSDNLWEYQYSERKSLADSGQLTTSVKESSTIHLPIDDGLWLLEVTGNDPLVTGSTMIEFGSWSIVGQASSPEALTITSDKARYADGEKVKINIRAPFDGPGSVKLASGDIFKTYEVDFKDHEATLSFKWDDDWTQGVWLLASAWQDKQDATLAQVQRAVGLAWLGTDTEPYALHPNIDAPAVIKPDGKLVVNVDVAQAGSDTWVNVAIIDEGLYRLAPPSFTDPLLTFYGKSPWALSLYDIWGQIIQQTDAVIANLRSGADGAGAPAGLADLPNIDTPLITYWSTPVRVEDGKVSITMDVPRFHGKLRVMALAYDEQRMGVVESDVLVKEDVVSELYAPLYASPEDQSSARIRLHNTTEREQTVAVALSSTNLEMKPLDETITLAADEERWIEQGFRVGEADSASITATINDVSIERNIDIRPRALSVLHQQYKMLKPGETVTIPEGSVYALGGLGLDHQQIVDDLNDYPYYCSEQTASRLLGSIGGDKTTYAALMNTQSRLVNLQQSNGGFSLWKEAYTSDIWLSAYIGEALLRAQEADVLAHEQSLKSLLNYLRSIVADRYESGPLGYAHYVLAKAGVNMQGAAIRYAASLEEPSFDSNSLETVLALYLYGEDERAEALWERLSGEGEHNRYQTVLSELAERLYRLHELSEYRDVSAEIAETSQSIRTQLNGYYSTQELAWLHLLGEFAQPAEITIDGKAETISTLTGFAQKATKITNTGDQAVALTISDRKPGDPNALVEEGYSIELTYTDLEGNAVSLDNLPVNQEILVRADIYRDDALYDRNSEIMFVYPYTAGEQGMKLAQTDEVDWPNDTENRDDRHLAAFTFEEGATHLTHEFAVRTTRDGVWHAPGVSVEDMYRPDLKAQYPTREIYVGTVPERVTETPAIQLESVE